MRTIVVLAVASALAAFGLGTATTYAQSDRAPVPLTVDQWRADLQFLAHEMPLKHKDLFHTMTPDTFRQAVNQLNADIPTLNDDQIALRLFEIAAMPVDSHTGPRGLPQDSYFPLRLRHYDDGLYVESAAPKYADAVGGRLVSIGSTDANAIYTQLLAVMPHDAGNPGLLEVIGPLLMTSGRVLHGLGVEPTSDSATFTVAKGTAMRRFTVTPQVTMQTLFGHAPIAGWLDARGAGPAPLWLTHPDRTFWSTYLPEQRLFYIQFNEVEDAKDETVEQFFSDAFQKASRLRVDKLVLDIRTNDGGDNHLITPIIVGLVRMQSIDRLGHLFVLTSRNTYSAAQNLVNRLENYTNAIFVGQPTGQHVNSYGDPTPIELPNSHLRVFMASVWWQDMDPRDKRIETDPELAADPTFADYVAGRDPALDVILAYRPGESLGDSVLKGVAAGGPAGGLAAYRAYASNPLHRYQFTQMERKLNNLGYALISNRRLSEAIAVFTVNAEANQGSANAADSLGEAYADAGNRTAAIESYRRALELDPALQSSRDALTRLGASGQSPPHR